MPNATDTDLDTRIAEAEREVIDTDAHFLRSTGELVSAMRGRAGKAVATSAMVGAALVTALVIYRTVSARKESHRRAQVRRGAPAPAVPLRRSGAGGFIGEAIGSAFRAAASPRSSGLLSLLTATLVPILIRMRRERQR